MAYSNIWIYYLYFYFVIILIYRFMKKTKISNLDYDDNYNKK